MSLPEETASVRAVEDELTEELSYRGSLRALRVYNGELTPIERIGNTEMVERLKVLDPGWTVAKFKNFYSTDLILRKCGEKDERGYWMWLPGPVLAWARATKPKLR